MTNTASGTVAQLKQKAIEQLSDPVLPTPNERSTFSFEELWATKDIEQKFIIPDLLPAHAVAVLIGEDGIGKTQILTQLCLNIALGRKTFLGLNLHCEHNKCLVIATEDSKEKFTKALVKQALSLEPSLNPKKVHIDFTEGSNFDDMKLFREELERNLKLHKYDLVVCDAMSDLFTLIDGDINSNSHARKILSIFQALVNTYQTTMLIIHHASKSKIVAKQKENKLFVEKGDSQGAGAITQKPRTIWALTNDPKSICNEGTQYTNYLHVVKANLMGKHFMTHALKLEFDAHSLTHSACGLVDIQMMESSGQEPEPTSVHNPGKKPSPEELTIDQHRANVFTCFIASDTATRTEIIERLASAYKVGRNKVESKEGYLPYLLEQGIIINNAGIYRKGEKSEFIMPTSTADWDLVPSKLDPFNNSQNEDICPF